LIVHSIIFVIHPTEIVATFPQGTKAQEDAAHQHRALAWAPDTPVDKDSDSSTTKSPCSSTATAATLNFNLNSDCMADEWNFDELLRDTNPAASAAPSHAAMSVTHKPRRKSADLGDLHKFKPGLGPSTPRWTSDIITASDSILERQRGRKLAMEPSTRHLLLPEEESLASVASAPPPAALLDEDQEVNDIVQMLLCEDAELDDAINIVRDMVGDEAA